MCVCMFECMCVSISVCVQMQTKASGWIESLPQSLFTYSLGCGFTIEPKTHWRSRSVRLACSCRRGDWILICCPPNSRVTDRFPCPSDTYMGAKDLISGPSPVLMLGLTGVFTMSHFPSTSCLVWFGILKHVLAVEPSLVPRDSLCGSGWLRTWADLLAFALQVLGRHLWATTFSLTVDGFLSQQL